MPHSPCRSPAQRASPRCKSHRIKIGAKGKRYVVRQSPKSGAQRREYLGSPGKAAQGGKAKLHVGPRGGRYYNHRQEDGTVVRRYVQRSTRA